MREIRHEPLWTAIDERVGHVSPDLASKYRQRQHLQFRYNWVQGRYVGLLHARPKRRQWRLSIRRRAIAHRFGYRRTGHDCLHIHRNQPCRSRYWLLHRAGNEWGAGAHAGRFILEEQQRRTCQLLGLRADGIAAGHHSRIERFERAAGHQYRHPCAQSRIDHLG